MPQKVSSPKLPRGLARIFFRTPIYLYRLGLGWLMGQRFLLINHVGRKSGLERQVVVEVVHHDEASDAYYIAAGFGPRTYWYQNLLKTPWAQIQVGRRKMDALATPLIPKEATKILRSYAEAYASAAKALAKFMGYETDGTVEDFAALGEDLKLMRLSPKR